MKGSMPANPSIADYMKLACEYVSQIGNNTIASLHYREGDIELNFSIAKNKPEEK